LTFLAVRLILQIMDASDIKKLLDDTRKQEDEIRKDREALERVARLLKLPSVSNGRKNGEQELFKSPPRARNFSEAIREAIKSQEGEFTIRDIAAFLEDNYADMNPKKRYQSISSILGQFKGRYVSVSSSGTGVPNVYKRIEAN
jgi:hypothetical protein